MFNNVQLHCIYHIISQVHYTNTSIIVPAFMTSHDLTAQFHVVNSSRLSTTINRLSPFTTMSTRRLHQSSVTTNIFPGLQHQMLGTVTPITPTPWETSRRTFIPRTTRWRTSFNTFLFHSVIWESIKLIPDCAESNVLNLQHMVSLGSADARALSTSRVYTNHADQTIIIKQLHQGWNLWHTPHLGIIAKWFQYRK